MPRVKWRRGLGRTQGVLRGLQVLLGLAPQGPLLQRAWGEKTIKPGVDCAQSWFIQIENENKRNDENELEVLLDLAPQEPLLQLS